MSPTSFLTDPRLPKWFMRVLVACLATFSLWAGGKLWAGGEQSFITLQSDMKKVDTRLDGYGERISRLETILEEAREHNRDMKNRMGQVMEYLLRIDRRVR